MSHAAVHEDGSSLFESSVLIEFPCPDLTMYIDLLDAHPLGVGDQMSHQCFSESSASICFSEHDALELCPFADESDPGSSDAFSLEEYDEMPRFILKHIELSRARDVLFPDENSLADPQELV